MKRFRFTLLAVCLLLIYLGWTDVALLLRNPSPARVTITELELEGPPREWMDVTGGYQDLERAISTSGTVEVDALLVPLLSMPDEETITVFVETRHPELLELFTTYHFKLDSALAKERFLEENRERFHAQRTITGMEITGLIATGNRDRMMELARQIDLPVAEDVVFISEGKEPARYRGFFFLAAGLLGALKLLWGWRKKPATGPGE